jgi:predicted nucleic acid-binding protein
MAKLLFIDTNIFLSFYEFTRDDLEELKKLSAMLQKDELTLLLPNQVMDEFWRNRDQRIAAAVRHVAHLAKRREYPRLFQGLGEYEMVRKLEDESEAQHRSLLSKAEAGARNRGFPADILIAELFSRAKQIGIEPAYIERARSRRELGRPPGKKDSLGDAVNWEALRDTAKDQDLHFVSGDNDWVSPVSPLEFNGYLQEEWRKTGKSNVVYYPLLSSFFQKNYPEIKLEADVGVELLIKDLAESGSFASTHAAIEELARIVDFTPRQVVDICKAYVDNGQVRRIIGDEDVEAFLRRIIVAHSDDIDFDVLDELNRLLRKVEQERPGPSE